jgi:lysophospholipase L1-like esterase
MWGFDADWDINEHGYRGKAFSRDKPPGVKRAVIYGGSAVFDLGAGQGRDWPSRVEHALQEQEFANVEVINAGIPRHASFDSLGRVFAEGHHFRPDFLLLYNAWNDLKLFSSDEPLLRQIKPFDPTKNPILNYRNRLDRQLWQVSEVYNLLRFHYFRNKYRVGQEGRMPAAQTAQGIAPAALDQYRLNLEMFVDVARNIDAVPVLMTQARLITRDNQETEQARLRDAYQYLPPMLIYEGMQRADEIIRSVARDKGVELIDASTLMTGEGAYFRDHVHLSEQGSSRLSAIVSEHLASLLRR